MLKINSLLSIVFAVFGISFASYTAEAAQCNCRTEWASYCAGTCNYCTNGYQQDYAYPKTVTSLPYNFNYSHGDTNTGNDVCGSSQCGTKYCNAGTTSYSNNRLPANGGYCTLTPNNRVPASLNCGWADGSCQTYCSDWRQYSYWTCDQC